MFARFDYPATPAFLDAVRAEADAFLDRAQAHPCLAVLCGGMEVAQSAAMAGRPPAEWSTALFDDVLAGAASAWRPDVAYVAHAPGGGVLPFAASAPVAHYFGVGGYLRPLGDLHAAGVAFAAECLAFANPPDPAGCRAMDCMPGDPIWRAGVVRDIGGAWDFEDVRDHYVGTLFGLDPAMLRRNDPSSWLAHGRAAVALLMEQALGIWRTDGVCAGALVLMLQDRAAGAGWGCCRMTGGRNLRSMPGRGRASRSRWCCATTA
jgi:beta-mannosidase